ncbi:MAG: FAD-dependent oxidoreductase [Candidatus Saccharibacteria bacterium]|nr:FAD-dependent oxidoreductase [Candidatus Saccharibacteria bacterium]
MSEKVIDVAIIGAGIAGLTAAIYARRANKTVVVLEEKVYGGQILSTFTVGNWPGDPDISGPDLMKKIYHHVNKLGAGIRYEKVLEVRDLGELKEVKTDERVILARSVIIATGTIEKEMGVLGEKEFFGRGISYCATCDGALYQGKEVVVVGGGNSAFYNALYLADVCSKVYIVHRREEFRADATLVDKVRTKGNVEFILASRPVEVLGSEKLEGLVVEDSVGGRREISAAAIFVAVGKQPATEVFSGLLKMDEAGYIIAGEECMTSVDGIFVAGDCRTKCMKQLITAAADGAIAGNAAAAYAGKTLVAACVDE